MGGDGGSIPKRDDLVKTRGKQEQVRFLCIVLRVMVELHIRRPLQTQQNLP